MKFTIDLDCTPEEARRFLGLPDVAPMQDKTMEEIEARMLENIRSLDPETFIQTWMPLSVQGWGDLQKMFWSQMGADLSEREQREEKQSGKKSGND